ncbi:MAG: restriction endonuclease subunit S, partial [Planktothrix sp.]
MNNKTNMKKENIPALRFPAFANAPPWEEKTLGEVAEIITGNTPLTTEDTFYGGDKLFVSPQDINSNRYLNSTKKKLTELGFSKTRKIPANSVLFSCIGSIG